MPIVTEPTPYIETPESLESYNLRQTTHYMNHREITEIECLIHPYASERFDISEAAHEIAQFFESKIEQRKDLMTKQILLNIFEVPTARKSLIKYIKNCIDHYFLESLFCQCEARKRQLNPKFTSETPRG